MKQLLLAIDDVSLPFRKSVGLYMTPPDIRPEPVLEPSPFESNAPDNIAAHFYGTVIEDEGTFRMWYYACHWGINDDMPPIMKQQVAKPPHWFNGDVLLQQGPICYAESDDGISWRKPPLGQVLFKGSRENNIIEVPHAIIAAASVIKDADDPDPARRYKMAYQYFPDQSDPSIHENGYRPTVALAVSPDGIKWSGFTIPFWNQFVEHCSLIKHDGKFMINYHVMDSWADYFSEGGSPCGRTAVARISDDWDQWPDLLVDAFSLPEPEDRSLRGMSGPYDQVHMGVGAASFGNVCIGIYGIWHNANNQTAFAEISGDMGLLISNDGIHYREPVKGARYLRREDSPARPCPGHDFKTVLCQGNGILNVGDETRIYHGRWRNAISSTDGEVFRYSSGEVGLATIPRDRWGALAINPGATKGDVCTTAITLTAKSLTLNADDLSGVTVDVVNEKFQAFEGFTGGTSGRVSGGFDCEITWPGGSLTTLQGQTVRFWVHLTRQDEINPRIYALNLMD